MGRDYDEAWGFFSKLKMFRNYTVVMTAQYCEYITMELYNLKSEFYGM